MGSRKVASLYIDVGASVAKLTGSLSKAKAKVKQFKRETSKSFAGIKRAVFSAKGALLGLAGAGGFGMLIGSAMKTADEIGKMSDRLNMSAETFQALHHQAGLFGVSAGMVNSSVERMVKRLGEAANGMGAAKTQLEKMNISAKEMIGLNADQQYMKIADAIGGLATHSERAAATAALFGREGIKMVGMFATGADGIRDARDELDSFGIAMDRVQIKKIENANDSFHRVTQVIKGAAAVVAAELAPYLEFAAKWFLENAKQAGGFGEIAKDVMGNVRTAIGWVLTGLDYMAIGWETIRLGVITFATVALNGLNSLVEPIRYVNELLGNDQPEAFKVLTGMVEGFEQAAFASQEKLAGMIGTVGQNAEAAKVALADVAIAADSVANIDVAAAGPVAETPDEAYARVTETKASEQQALDEALAFKWAAEEAYRQEALAADRTNAEARMGVMSKTMTTLGALMGAKSKKLFKIGKASAIANALINTFQAVTKTMSSMPFPLNVPLAAAQGVAGMVQVQKIRSQTMTAREFGGPVVRGRPYEVGERGREIFVPDQSGTIIPNKDIGEGGMNFNLNINAVDAKSVADLFTENKDVLYNLFLDALNEEGRTV